MKSKKEQSMLTKMVLLVWHVSGRSTSTNMILRAVFSSIATKQRRNCLNTDTNWKNGGKMIVFSSKWFRIWSIHKATKDNQNFGCNVFWAPAISKVRACLALKTLNRLRKLSKIRSLLRISWKILYCFKLGVQMNVT